MARDGSFTVRILGEVDDLRKKLKQGGDDVQRFGNDSAKALKGTLDDAIANVTSRFGALGNAAEGTLSGIAEKAVASGGAIGVGIATGAAAAGAGIAALAVKGVQSFVDLAGKVRDLQRVTGATAEESSALVAVFDDMGISADQGGAAIFKLSRNILANADALQANGIEIAKNADGTTDLIGTLLNVADAYKEAGGGAEGNKIAMDAFGRSGAALIPILEQGRSSIEAMFAEADKHDEILSQKDVRDAREFELAMDDLGDAVGGLTRNVGAGLVPALADGANWMARFVDGANRLTKPLGGLPGLVEKFVANLPGIREVKLGMDALEGSTVQTKTAALDHVRALAMEREALEADKAAAAEAEAAHDALAAAKMAAATSSVNYERSLLGLEAANQAVTDAQAALAKGGSGAARSQRDVAAAARAVEDAQRGVEDAHRRVEDAQRGIEDAARRVQDALREQDDAARGVEDALRNVEEASERVSDAHDRIADSARDAADAQTELAEAQADAAKLADDLWKVLNGAGAGSKEASDATEELDDINRDLQRSQLALIKAQEKLTEVQSDGTSTAGDIKDAELDVADAQDRVQDTTRKLTDAQKALDIALNGTIASAEEAQPAMRRLEDANKRVKDAQDRVAEAAEAQTEAQKGLRDAHRGVEEASRGVETAQRAVADAALAVSDAHRGEKDAARDLADAQRGVRDANREVKEAIEDRDKGISGSNATVKTRAELERDLKTALLDQKQAYIDAAQAYVDRAADIAEASGKTMTATEKTRLFHDRLNQLAGTLHPDSLLRKELMNLVNDLEKIESKDVTVTITRREIVENVRPGERPQRMPVGDGPGAVGSATTAAGMAAEAAAMFGGRITSGYRSPEHNRRIGGSPTSYHIDRMNPAQDLVAPDMAGAFRWLTAKYGSRAREFIYGNTKIVRGRAERYYGNDHWDHVHVAHTGARVDPSWPTIPGLRQDERPVIAQVGETVSRGGAVAQAAVMVNVTVGTLVGSGGMDEFAEKLRTKLVEIGRRNGGLGFS